MYSTDDGNLHPFSVLRILHSNKRSLEFIPEDPGHEVGDHHRRLSHTYLHTTDSLEIPIFRIMSLDTGRKLKYPQKKHLKHEEKTTTLPTLMEKHESQVILEKYFSFVNSVKAVGSKQVEVNFHLYSIQYTRSDMSNVITSQPRAQKVTDYRRHSTGYRRQEPEDNQREKQSVCVCE